MGSLLRLAAALAAPRARRPRRHPSASATISASQITAPANPSFFIADLDAASQTFAVSGATTGGGGGDKVDALLLRREVREGQGERALKLGRLFSAPTADLTKLLDLACQLKAVPAGSNPADLTPFSGPVGGVGDRQTAKVGGGTGATES